MRDYAEGLSDNEKVTLSGGPHRHGGRSRARYGGDVEVVVDMGANVYVEADAVKASNKVL